MRTFALTIAALLLVSSCTDDPEPIEPKPSKPSPSQKAPPMPSVARSQSPKGQVAFVRHVVSVLNYSGGSGSTKELEGLFARDCKACQQYVARVDSDNAGQGHVDGFNWSVTEGEVLEDDQVEVVVKAAPYQRVDPKTGEISKVKGATYQLGFELETRGRQWLVQKLYVPESQ